MRRRRFLTAGAAYAAVFGYACGTANASKLFRLAVVHPSRSTAQMSKQAGPPYGTFFLELDRLGFVEGQNLSIERYSAMGSRDRLAQIVREAALSNPDVILASSGRTVLLLEKETRSIPIVGYVSDPISYGITNSLSHPGGNVTGVIVDSGIETWEKRLEILKEAIPSVRRVFHIAPKTSWDSGVGIALQAAAQNMGLVLIGPPIESPCQEADYRNAFSEVMSPDACLLNSAPENLSASKIISRLVQENRLLAMCPYREFVVDGCAMSYDVDLSDLNSFAAHQVASIFHGAKPGDIPFYQPKQFRFVMNATAIEKLGINLSQSILGRVDEVL